MVTRARYLPIQSTIDGEPMPAPDRDRRKDTLRIEIKIHRQVAAKKASHIPRAKSSFTT